MGLRVEAFWSNVDKTSGCWIWTASKDSRGYGQFWVDRHLKRTHRIAYELANGPIPDGRDIHHVCARRECVNPAHLRAVTRREHPDAGPAVNAAKTHCPQGHEYTPANTWIDTYGGKRQRRCRECLRAQWRRRETRRTNADRGRDAAYWRAFRTKKRQQT